MRFLLALVVFALAPSCSCAACASSKPTAPPPATAAVAQAVEPEKPAPQPAVAPRPGGELPPEVVEGSPSDEAILAAYEANCAAEITVSYEDMDGPQQKADCEALAFDQNCSPDGFGCYDAVTKCRGECGEPCGRCQGTCAGACSDCKAACADADGGACRRACAQRRADCRKTCLYEVQRCRFVTCNAEYERCEADAAKRTKGQCPDCEKIGACLLERSGGEKPLEDCLPPGNAKECLEWCSPGM